MIYYLEKLRKDYKMKRLEKDLKEILKEEYIGSNLINVFVDEDNFYIEVLLTPLQSVIYNKLKECEYNVEYIGESIISGNLNQDKINKKIDFKEDFIKSIISNIKKVNKYIDEKEIEDNFNFSNRKFEKIDDFYLTLINEENKFTFELTNTKKDLYNTSLSEKNSVIKNKIIIERKKGIETIKKTLADAERSLIEIMQE